MLGRGQGRKRGQMALVRYENITNLSQTLLNLKTYLP